MTYAPTYFNMNNTFLCLDDDDDDDSGGGDDENKVKKWEDSSSSLELGMVFPHPKILDRKKKQKNTSVNKTKTNL